MTAVPEVGQDRVGRSAARYLPILGWLPSYRRRWFVADAVAAISVWALLVPQSLGYATLAGVPVQYGLYTAFAALVAYAIFGTSKQVVQGPSGSVAAVSAAVITPLVGAAAIGTNEAVATTAALAITTGLLYLALGIARMGWISNFLSRAVMSGFVLGFSIGINQLIATGGATVHAVVVDMEAVSQTDTDGGDLLTSMAAEMRVRNIWFGVARAEATILDQWDRGGAIDAIDRDHVFESVREASEAAARHRQSAPSP